VSLHYHYNFMEELERLLMLSLNVPGVLCDNWATALLYSRKQDGGDVSSMIYWQV
jgi:hypothetical protein